MRPGQETAASGRYTALSAGRFARTAKG